MEDSEAKQAEEKTSEAKQAEEKTSEAKQAEAGKEKGGFWARALSGSYTVEASYVVSIILLVIMSVTILGFGIYAEGVTYVTQELCPEHRDEVDLFRGIALGKEFLENL